MMAKLQLLLISFLSAAFKAATADWPSGYSVDWWLSDGESHSITTAKHYFSQKEKAYRWDIDDGANTFIFTVKDEKTSGLYYYFPTMNGTDVITNCTFIPIPPLEPGKKIVDTLPDLTGMSFSENMTINGSPAEKLIRDGQENSVYEKATAWVKRGNGQEDTIPIRLEIELRGEEEHSDLNAEKIAVDFYNYLAKEPENNIWSLPKDFCHPDPQNVDIILTYLSEKLFKAFDIPLLKQNTNKRKRGFKRVDKVWESALPFPHTNEDIQLLASSLPKAFDWRNHYRVVTSVKDQGMCGSCWAFGVTGALEGAYLIKYGGPGDMSEQALVDCGWSQDANGTIAGCFGGNSGAAFDWIKKHGGLPWTEDYGDYKGINGRCSLNHVRTHGAIKGFVQVNPDVDAVKVALYHHGPLTVSISTPSVFREYKNGIIKNVSDPGSVDHSVLLVGYGSLNGDDYWIIKNSWGKGWGLAGFGLISTNNNTLNLLNYVYYPELL